MHWIAILETSFIKAQVCVQAVGKQESLCSNEFPSFDGVLVDAEGDAHNHGCEGQWVSFSEALEEGTVWDLSSSIVAA